MKELVNQWFEQSAPFEGILACGIRFPDQTSLSKTWADGFEESAVENALRCVGDGFQVAQLNRITPIRLRWVYSLAFLYCERRQDGTILGVFTMRIWSPSTLMDWNGSSLNSSRSRAPPRCDASSGIAATLLTGGRTAHSALKLPLNLAQSEAMTCNISKGTGQAYVLKQCKLIVWDEATMCHRNAFQALDKTLRDLTGCDKLMGSVPVVLSGDFRQTLPIITRGTPADEIRACLKNSYIWPQVKKFSLTTNMLGLCSR